MVLLVLDRSTNALFFSFYFFFQKKKGPLFCFFHWSIPLFLSFFSSRKKEKGTKKEKKKRALSFVSFILPQFFFSITFSPFFISLIRSSTKQPHGKPVVGVVDPHTLSIGEVHQALEGNLLEACICLHYNT